MEILAKAPECYIQQCDCCGAVLRYSKCDIHMSGVPFYVDNGDQWVCGYDAIICPSCNEVLKAKREWLIDMGWIKKLLKSVM